MLVEAITSQLEAAIPAAKRYAGSVASAEYLLKRDRLECIQIEFAHFVFAFLAFHPTSDRFIAEYVMSGSLSSDSGEGILVLFTVEGVAPAPKALTETALGVGVEITDGVHPSYVAARRLFLDNEPPTLPALLVMPAFVGETEAVACSLQGLDGVQAVKDRLVTYFNLVTEARASSRGKHDREFATALSTKLRRRRFAYQRSGRKSSAEWLVDAINLARRDGKELVTVATVIATGA